MSATGLSVDLCSSINFLTADVTSSRSSGGGTLWKNDSVGSVEVALKIYIRTVTLYSNTVLFEPAILL